MIAAYLRFSPRPRAKVYDEIDSMPKSFATQRYQITRYLRDRGMTDDVHWVEDELVSARRVPLHERHGGAQLQQLIDDGCRQVIVASLDRLFRDMWDGLNVLELWNKPGVILHTCNGVSVEIGSATGTMLVQQMLCLAEFEPAQIAERTKIAKDRQKAGNFRTGRFPRFGWRFDTDKLHPKTGLPYMEIKDVLEQDIRRQIFDWKDEGQTLTGIAKRLNEERVFSPLRTRKSWDASFVKKVLLQN